MNNDSKPIKNNFTTPPNYLESVKQSILDNARIAKIDLDTTSGFTVPENYFKSLEQELLEIKSKNKTQVIPLKRKAIIYSISAVAAIFIALIWVVNPVDNTLDFNDITSAALEDYLESDDIQDYLTPNDVLEIEQNATFMNTYTLTEDVLLEHIEAQALEEALVDE